MINKTSKLEILKNRIKENIANASLAANYPELKKEAERAGISGYSLHKLIETMSSKTYSSGNTSGFVRRNTTGECKTCEVQKERDTLDCKNGKLTKEIKKWKQWFVVLSIVSISTIIFLCI